MTFPPFNNLKFVVLVSDMGLGWKQSTCSSNIPAFYGLQGLHINLTVTGSSSYFDFVHLSFNIEIPAVIQNEINMYAEQHINKKQCESTLKTKSDYAKWEEADLQEM
jgi:hypothetical protein